MTKRKPKPASRNKPIRKAGQPELAEDELAQVAGGGGGVPGSPTLSGDGVPGSPTLSGGNVPGKPIPDFKFKLG